MKMSTKSKEYDHLNLLFDLATYAALVLFLALDPLLGFLRNDLDQLNQTQVAQLTESTCSTFHPE